MPKRNTYKGNRNWNQNNPQRFSGNSYNEHDDRDRKPNGGDLTIRKDNNRRVSFKTSAGPHGRNNNMKSRTAELGIRARLEDDDELMSIEAKSDRMRRRGSPIPRSAKMTGKGRTLVDNASGWFQVLIPYGQKYDKDFLLKSLLQAMSPEIFIPHYWKVESTSTCFYVDDITMARALLNLDRKVELPDGFRMIIKVRNSVPPVQLDVTARSLMKLAMEKRFSPLTKALDLTKFHSDELLRDVFCGLFRPTIMIAAIEIIADNIPDLEALNLENNKIHNMDHFKFLVMKLPNLKILHMANNKITTPASLDYLKQGCIEDLVLTGNPIKNRFRDHTTYVSEIRKRLTKLRKLDGEELPPQIGFDIEDEATAKIPVPNASFLCNQAGGDMVREFLQAYYVIYDSDNRQPLLNAYHEHSSFSLTCSFTTNPSHRLVKYLPHNRNINRIRDLDQKCALLKTGALQVVSFLSDLPSTQHDPNSFAVDLTLYTPAMIVITITGIFREKGAGPASTSSTSTFRPNAQSNEQPLRSFQRSLVIVPQNSGFCIKNDMLHINTLTAAQVRTAFKPLEPVAISTPVVPAQPIPVVATALPAQNVIPPDDATKLQMVEAMVNCSQMNVEWSKRCLEETNWNFERAGYIFTELHKQNKIPPEAFEK